jgi:hypothetical protein
MVNVVAALPPTDGKTTAEIRNEHSNKGVGHKVGCNRKMTGIVRRKHDLML